MLPRPPPHYVSKPLRLYLRNVSRIRPRLPTSLGPPKSNTCSAWIPASSRAPYRPSSAYGVRERQRALLHQAAKSIPWPSQPRLSQTSSPPDSGPQGLCSGCSLCRESPSPGPTWLPDTSPHVLCSHHRTERPLPTLPSPSRMYCFILITLALFHICSLPSSPLERRLPDGRNYVLFIAESLAPRTGLRTGLVLSISGMNALISSSNKVILFGLIGKMKLGEGQGQLRVPQWTPGAVLVGTPTSHPGAAGPSSPQALQPAFLSDLGQLPLPV